MGNGCSVSGGWFLKALEHEYIDKRVLLAVTVKGSARLEQLGRLVQFLELPLKKVRKVVMI